MSRVQLSLPLTAQRRVVVPRRSGHRLTLDGETCAVVIARHRAARRYVLRVVGADTLRLTVPRGASIAGGLRFAERQATWIARERRRRKDQSTPWSDGTELLFRGERVRLRAANGRVRCGAEDVAIGRDADVRRALEAHFIALASVELPPRLLALAARHHLTVAQVSVRDQRSRWGACSPRAVITLNWRLVQMPASVSDYILLHELMHLRQPNHSRRFWREVASVCPNWREEERWLRRFGREIL